MATGGIFLFGTTGGGSGNSSDLVIDADTQDYNVLTAATAAGYDNSAGTDFTITLTINSGVNVTASGLGLTALTTGALNANTTLTIINNGNIQGSNGSTGGSGGNGSSGGKGIFFNTITGGTATHSLENNGTVSGGGGGGGGAGIHRPYTEGEGGTPECGSPVTGSAGSTGAYGASGTSGSYNASRTTDDTQNCAHTAPGSGGAGGDSIDKNGRTVAQSGSGFYNGNQQA